MTFSLLVILGFFENLKLQNNPIYCMRDDCCAMHLVSIQGVSGMDYWYQRSEKGDVELFCSGSYFSQMRNLQDELGHKKLLYWHNLTYPKFRPDPGLFSHEKRKKDIIKSCVWKHGFSKIENFHKADVRNFRNDGLLCNLHWFYLWVLFMIGESIFLHVQSEISEKFFF